MGRWARGDEIACDAGRCRNLAEWKVISDLYRSKTAARIYLLCGLHLRSSVRLLQQRKEVYDPAIEPFQDAGAPAPRKRKRGSQG